MITSMVPSKFCELFQQITKPGQGLQEPRIHSQRAKVGPALVAAVRPGGLAPNLWDLCQLGEVLSGQTRNAGPPLWPETPVCQASASPGGGRGGHSRRSCQHPQTVGPVLTAGAS